jgi:asparagine N-glycosylation enzyme membrane subunit Stt3
VSPSHIRHGLIYLLYALAALACLTVPSYPYVLPQGRQPRLLGPDAYFHLRHTRTVLSQYPLVARQDLMVKFPEGESGMNQGFFDLSLATVIKLSGGWIGLYPALRP